MPTYTYRCTNCEHQFEARQRMMDDALTECPECEGKVRRVVNSVGVVFKGQGFYVTDNRGKKTKTTSTSNKKEDSETKDTAKSSEGKTDKKSSNSESKPNKSEKSSSPA